jgi:TM2 domain-containing membrane protein YozV
MSAAHYKSKTLATWIAVIGGGFGLHRFYLNGFRDLWGWLHGVPTLIGLYGVQRMMILGQDDMLAWALIPLLGFMLAGAMLAGIVYGLTPDEKWDLRHNPGSSVHATGWGAVLGVIVALLLGASLLMATIAFSGQRYFEYQVEEGRKISQ